MKSNLIGSLAMLAVVMTASWAQAASPMPTAIFAFEERGEGVKNAGKKVSDILFAALATRPDIMLVDRTDIEKLLQEHEVNMSGIVSPDQAVKIGQMTGAKILITGSIIDADGTLYLVAKIIGTETSRVLGASVKGRTPDDLASLTEKLAQRVADTIAGKSELLVAKEVKLEDRIAALKQKLGPGKRPVVYIHVTERHVGQATLDPAAQTELALICKETGFEVLDHDADSRKADIRIEGEGFSEFAMRRGNLVSVKARLELKAVDNNSRIVATDRQTAVTVDLTEQLAGKNALQEAATAIAERLLPKLVTQ